MSQSQDQAAVNTEQALSPANPNRRIKIIFSVIALVVIIAAAAYGLYWWREGRFFVSTDDAYVAGDIANIAPKVSGYIDTIPIQANQYVKQGDVLFQLDDGDYRIAYEQTLAALETQKQSLARIDAQIVAARTSLDEAQSNRVAAEAVLTNARLIYQRTQRLSGDNIVPQSQADNAKASLDEAQANLTSADARIAAAQANIGVLEAQRREANSQTRNLELNRDQALRNLEYTILRAPFDGVIGNLSGKEGDLVTNGQRLAALVPLHELYIDANYKETQLGGIAIGQIAHISVDSINNARFEGRVVSVAPASGAVFSLLPPQNATGNFTKVVQRIPVRISIPEDALTTGRIRAGMSVVVDIDIRTTPQTEQ